MGPGVELELNRVIFEHPTLQKEIHQEQPNHIIEQNPVRVPCTSTYTAPLSPGLSLAIIVIIIAPLEVDTGRLVWARKTWNVNINVDGTIPGTCLENETICR